MDVESLLRQAIESRKPVALEYSRPGKVQGVRVGHPHIMFMLRPGNGQEKTYVLMWQTGGVSDHKQTLPAWRQFFVADISNVEVLAEEPSFDVAPGYDPSRYEFPVAHIDETAAARPRRF